ncbi:hypothetical protein TNCV_2475761, partial [Trichonephila clavipes]
MKPNKLKRHFETLHDCSPYLSNDTVSRRIDDISEDVEQQLFGKLRDKLFSIQLDEATDSNKMLISLRMFDFGMITHKIHLGQLILQSAQYAYPYIIKLIYMGEKQKKNIIYNFPKRKVDGVKHTSKFEGQRDDNQKYYSRGYKK